MRTLDSAEIALVSGGFVGTKIPFSTNFFRGPNWPGGFPAAINMVLLSFQAGWAVGSLVNQAVNSTFSMSTGEALYHTING